MDHNNLRKIFLVAVYCLAMLCSYGRVSPTDSLLQIVKNNKDPEKRIDALISLAYLPVTDKEKATEYAKQAYNIAVKSGDDKVRLKALMAESILYYILADIKNDMEVALEAKDLAEKLDMQNELAVILDGLGMQYYDLGDKKKCAEFYFASLKISERLKNYSLMGRTLGRIGVLYTDQNDFTSALAYLSRSLKIGKKLGDKEGMASNMNNIANVYRGKGDYWKSIYFLKEALKISKEIGNINFVGVHYVNIGKNYFKLKRYQDALLYYEKGLHLFDSISNIPRIAVCHLRMGEAELALRNYIKAGDDINAALKIAVEQGLKDVIYQSYKALHELSLAQNDIKAAYDYSQLENRWKDSLDISEKEKNLAQMELQYHFEKKEQVDKAERDRKNILNKTVIITLALSIIIILLIMNQLRLRAKKSKLENDVLEKELDFKKKELTLNVMSLMKKNEMLSDISKKIIHFENEATQEETRSALMKVGKELQKSAEEETLKEFTLRFKEVHKDFYDALLRRFPDLTPSELKLCAFLKLNMTTKEISELTGQRLNTLENARYRLRQKLGITNSEANLVTFLAQI